MQKRRGLAHDATKKDEVKLRANYEKGQRPIPPQTYFYLLKDISHVQNGHYKAKKKKPDIENNK